MTASIEAFGTGRDGRRVQVATLRSDMLTVRILTWGAALQDLRLAEIGHSLTLGGPRMAGYDGPMGYFGTIVGPVANRIGGAKAVIDGRMHHFPPNEGTSLLHGGPRGTQARHWAIDHADAGSLRLRLVLDAGDGGLPGQREIVADYRVEGAALLLALSAVTDEPTLINLANHSYWNLDGTPDYAGHTLRITADTWLPAEASLPTGEVRPVSGVFDLRAGRMLDLTEGYDHNFCLSAGPRPLTEVARLTGHSGIALHLATTAPGLQVYDGRGLATAPFAGHRGEPCGPHAGIALEPQMWPDAPNHPAFPPITLAPGETWRQETRWRFTLP